MKHVLVFQIFVASEKPSIYVSIQHWNTLKHFELFILGIDIAKLNFKTLMMLVQFLDIKNLTLNMLDSSFSSITSITLFEEIPG